MNRFSRIFTFPKSGRAALLGLCLLLAGSCANSHQQSSKAMNITRIEYHFGDSSVPPPYHRSYSIVLTADSVHTVVDSYGDVVSENTRTINPDEFRKAVTALETFKIGLCSNVKEERGCTGGTSEAISYWEGEKKLFSASVYHCGGKDFGDLCGEVDQFAQLVKGMEPDLSQMTE